MKSLIQIRQLSFAVTVFALLLVAACGGGSRPEPIRSIPAYNQNPYQNNQYYQQLQQNPYQNYPYYQQQAPVTAPPAPQIQQAPAAVRPMTNPYPADNDEAYYPRYYFD